MNKLFQITSVVMFAGLFAFGMTLNAEKSNVESSDLTIDNIESFASASFGECQGTNDTPCFSPSGAEHTGPLVW